MAESRRNKRKGKSMTRPDRILVESRRTPTAAMRRWPRARVAKPSPGSPARRSTPDPHAVAYGFGCSSVVVAQLTTFTRTGCGTLPGSHEPGSPLVRRPAGVATGASTVVHPVRHPHREPHHLPGAVESPSTDLRASGRDASHVELR
jgi:hypothetical protein